jgi:hypothetical protein
MGEDGDGVHAAGEGRKVIDLALMADHAKADQFTFLEDILMAGVTVGMTRSH